MTKTEARKIDRLERENAELRERLDKHMEIYRSQLYEIVTYKTILEALRDSLRDAGI